MQIKELDRAKSMDAMKHWIDCNGSILPEVKDEYLSVRDTINKIADKVKSDNIKQSDYYTDVHIGLGLYNFLMQESGFSLRAAANDNFWRYISLIVAPNVVSSRWGVDNADHYWRKPSRIWFRQIWWYVHLSWQGDVESTRLLLESPNFSTDTILNLAERTGRNGTYIDVYRNIMYYYSKLPGNVIEQFINRVRKYDKHATLFRTVMKLNTAKTLVIEPDLYDGGSKGFAKSLFVEAGVNI